MFIREKIAVWPDGTVACLSDLEEYLTFTSDDYIITTWEELDELEREYYEREVFA